jgi:hypothetical protein
MKKLLAVLLFVSTMANAETYLQINGASVHTSPGYNGANYGAGIERDITENISIAGGFYQNSHSTTSAYAYARIPFYKEGNWNLGIGFGAVTGYSLYPVLPMVFPEACYSVVCAILVPPMPGVNAAALGVRLRIPLGE